jgi:hypothetical protein
VGFLKLIEFNMADITAEALILKYRHEVAENVVAAARRRLEKYDVRIAQESTNTFEEPQA